jgi:hypothetical protein
MYYYTAFRRKDSSVLQGDSGRQGLLQFQLILRAFTERTHRFGLMAQEAVAPEEKRQASVVRAVFESLRRRLQDTANLAQVLGLAGSAIARHFGIHWPF